MRRRVAPEAKTGGNRKKRAETKKRTVETESSASTRVIDEPSPEARLGRLQRDAGNQAVIRALRSCSARNGELDPGAGGTAMLLGPIAGNTNLPREPALTGAAALDRVDRRVLEERELEEAGTLAATEEIGNPISLAFHKYVVRNRDDLIDNATGAAFESVLKPHLTEKYVELLRDFYQSMVSGSTAIFGKAGTVAEAAIQADYERLQQSGASTDTATGRYAELRMLAANSGSSWDRSILFADVRNALQKAAADKGIEQAALDSEDLGNALDSSHRKLRSAVEGRARAVVDDQRDFFMGTTGAKGSVIGTKLEAYHRNPGIQDELGDEIRELMEGLRTGIGEEALGPILSETVEAVSEFATEAAEGEKETAFAALKGVFDEWSSQKRNRFKNQAIREAGAALNDRGTAEEMGQDAVKVVTEGYIHSGLAKAAPAIDALASKPDTNGTVKISIDVPIAHIATIGFEFQCKVARSSSDELSIAVDLGLSGGVGIPRLKAALGGGVYLDAKTKGGAEVLMDEVSLAFYRRFKDAGVPYTDSMWGLGGVTKREGESEDEAKQREAEAFAAMVEEKMGEEGEVETGGYGKGSLEADAGLLEAGFALVGKRGTLLDKRAFEETKERKASTSGFTVTLTAGAGPLKGTLTAGIRNVTYPKPDNSETVETTGSFGASLTGKVPGGAIYGNPAQMAVQIAVWIGELASKVMRAKELIERKDPGVGDLVAAYSLEEELREAAEAAKAGIEGEWAAKAAEFAESQSTKSLLTSSAGLTLGLSYAAAADGSGTGKVYIDLAKGNKIDTGIAKVEYTSGERLWSKTLGGGGS